MRQVEPQPADPLGPLDWLRLLPHETAASSDRLGWVGLEAARYQAASAAELCLGADGKAACHGRRCSRWFEASFLP